MSSVKPATRLVADRSDGSRRSEKRARGASIRMTKAPDMTPASRIAPISSSATRRGTWNAVSTMHPLSLRIEEDRLADSHRREPGRSRRVEPLPIMDRPASMSARAMECWQLALQ